MAKLTDSIATFKTGDLVFTRYPPKGVQPIHVTLFLSAQDSARLASGKAGYVHAGATHLEIAGIDTYAEDKDSGGYLHSFSTDANHRARTALVAKTFAAALTKSNTATPYGSFPGSADFAKMNKVVQSPHASRFTGMIRTKDISEIPFEFPALHRLLKWTYRAIVKAALSENRGTTCAAFVSICNQVAPMQAFFDDTGVSYKPKVIEECLQKLDSLVESKQSLRANLEVIAEAPDTGKPIYRDQAYRENSNRKLLDSRKQDLADLWAKVDRKQLDPLIKVRVVKEAKDPLPLLERIWLVIQTQMLGIPEFSVRLLGDIIGPDFMFDAKYVSSPVLADRLRNTKTWTSNEYTQY